MIPDLPPPVVLRDERIVLPPRARIVPVASTLAASLLAALPYVADAPEMPPFGLMLLLAWRLLRPEIWQAWVALPLGAFDDLVSGQPFGSATALWTITMLVLDQTDNRMVWHDYWHDLLNAALALAFCILGGWAIVAFTYGAGSILTMGLSLALAVLGMPLAMRIAARLDRFRLTR